MIASYPPLGDALAEAGYELLERLHQSRGFDVYDAWSLERRARVIVKAPRADRMDDPTLLRRLEREGRLLTRLSHPHILRGYELIPGPVPALVTETLRGETLSHLLDRAETLTEAEVGVLGLQLSSALAYLHDQGYLHLDLKPSNIVIDGGRAIVIDLSIAEPPGRGTPGLGTWCYLSPEQAAGGTLDAAADVWGIGGVLFEALTGRPAFDEDDDSGLPSGEEPDVYPQLEGRAPRIRTLREVTPALARAVDACLEPDPDRRPSIDELTAALESVPGVGSMAQAGR
ncbi:MAG TPA: serine/threonine-protein kinase [Gaiellaceae bacterium]|nr:serine/threonine-protein kinase [Gaiellaceae bacterium]